MSSSVLSRMLWWSLAAIALLVLLSWFFPPLLGHDALRQGCSWNYFVRTGNFAQLPQINQSDIAIEKASFLTWWSPGPFLAVGSLSAIGLDLGQSLSIWLGVCATLQLTGWLSLFRRLGYADWIAGLAAVLGAFGWHRLYSFRQFEGGDMFAGAVLPWAALALLTLRGRAWPRQLLVVCGLTLAGTLFKLSFIITMAGLVTGYWLLEFPASGTTTKRLRQGLLNAIPLAGGLFLALAATYATFLSHGPSPANGDSPFVGLKELSHALAMALTLPFSSVIAFGSIGGNLFQIFDWIPIDKNVPFLVLYVGFSVGLYYAIIKSSASRQSGFRFWIGLGIVHTIAYVVLYSRHAAVSFEDRLHVPYGTFLLPALVVVMAETRLTMVRFGIAGCLLVGVMWGTSSYVFRIYEIAQNANYAAAGYSLRNLPSEVDRWIRRCDESLPPGNHLFVASEIEALCAVRRNRIGILDPEKSSQPLRGRPDTVIVILAPDQNALHILPRFSDFAETSWNITEVDGWSIWKTRNSL